MHPDRPPAVQTWVLLEGLSDVAALRAVATTVGLDLDAMDVRVVDMGGVTNVRRHLRAAAERVPRPRVVGMCDAGEAGFVVRALREVGCDITSTADLVQWGFQVCDRDLEDELLRALSSAEVDSVLAGFGLLEKFAAFSRQPAWAGRDRHEQLHRFTGVASGRKELMAQGLAGALAAACLPRPLDGLVASLRPSFGALRLG